VSMGVAIEGKPEVWHGRRGFAPGQLNENRCC
jgi:hypothetical protein